MLTWKQNLKKLSKQDYVMLRELCRLSKNVYNESIYNIRQHYFAEGTYLRYEANYPLEKTSANYKLLGAQVAQQTMRCADASFKSFFALLRMKNQNAMSVGKVHIPHYLPKDAMYPLHLAQVQINDKHFIVSTSVEMKHKHNHVVKIRVPDKLLGKHIHQIHIIPKYDGKYFEVRYIFDEDSCDIPCSNGAEVLSIDLGVNNFATCVTSIGDSFIIDGRKIKSYNQLYNKKLARLSSIKDHQGIKKFTHLQYKITTKRNNRIDNFIYCAAKYIVNYCNQHDIGTIVLGYNDGFQDSPSLGKINNQQFVMLPYGKFRSRLNYLCNLKGIKFILQEESYTSKASFFDNDEIPSWNPRNPVQGKFSGKRICRGLYRTSTGKLINADVNGALNILRKSNLKDVTHLQARGEVTTPLRIRVI